MDVLDLRHRRGPTGRPGQYSRGFVLVSVIWISAIVGAFAISVTVSVRSHALYARNAMLGGLAKGIADGLLRLAALQMSTGNAAALRRQADGRWQSCRWPDGSTAWISVQDQGGLVDINTASGPLLRALLTGLGLTRDHAAAIAAAMRDYRDADSVALLGGSEPVTYPGRHFGPKNKPFEVVEELDQLPGMSPQLFLMLRQLTTVDTQQTVIDIDTAPVALRRALHLSRREGPHSLLASRVNAISVAVQLVDGTRFMRRAMIVLTDQPARPFVVTAWDGATWPDVSDLGPATREPCLQ